MSGTNFYTIGELSSICNVSPKTLRYYDEIGLVQPEYKSPDTGYRYYTKKQAFNIYIVKKLQQLDFSLTEICELLHADDVEVYEKRITAKTKSIRAKIESLQKAESESNLLLEKILQQQNVSNINESTVKTSLSFMEGKMLNGTIDIETEPDAVYLSTTKNMKLYNNFEISIDRWFEIFQLCEDNNLTPNGNIHLIYHTESIMDQFYKPECVLELAIPVDCKDLDRKLKGNCVLKTMPKGKAAVTYHYGPYDSIIHSHLRMMRWLEMNKYKVVDHTFEEYIISPFDLKLNSNYLTKIYYPVSR